MIDLGAVLKETLREVVREEVRAALAEHRGSSADELLDYEHAAAFAKLSKSTISLWVRRGLIPATGKGKTRRVLASDVRKALDGLAAAPKEGPKPARERALELLSPRARRRA